MLYYYQFDLAGIIILVFTVVSLWFRQRSLFRHAHYALCMLVTAFAFALSDALSAYLITLANPALYELTYIVLLVYFTALIIFPYFALQFIAKECGEMSHTGLALFIPVFFTLLLYFTNPSTGFFFVLQRNPLVYYSGRCYWISPGLYIFFMIYAAILVQKHRRLLGKQRCHVLMLVGIVSLGTFAMNFLLPNYSIVGFMIAVCISFTVISFYMADGVMDMLTGVYNRNGFLRGCDELIYKDKSNNLLLTKIKIHNLQEINERFGTRVGDLVLVRIADSLVKSRMSNKMIYGRIGGDTFAVLAEREYFEECPFHSNLGQFIGELISDMDYEVVFYSGVYPVKAEDSDVESILDRATYALDRVRGSFKEHVRFFDEELTAEYEQRSRIEQMARSALKHDAFRVYLQPIYDTMTRRLVSAEALVRWTDRDGTLISPDEFIPVFERNGFISQVDLFVLEEICKTIRSWIDHGIDPVPVSVNISRVDITSPRFADILVEVVDRYRIDHSLIKIELTESAFNDQLALIDSCMSQLRKQGFKILMDDFGSGYSNLNMFQDISVDIVKIDMKFLRNIDTNSKGRVILRSVVDMSKNLGLEIVVEGVETEEQFLIIREMSCEMTQGYYFSRPMPLQMFDDLLSYEHTKETYEEEVEEVLDEELA
ncbi:MAG: EAL domain-containing protein [Lachnospiraceae bacterium]|nr:EAL domain-containing protein [Lachnospiraceae bacterium]